jgi:UDP-N-acetylmuramoyl-L-alanyl-D-glutamate--2,6-diaminopimelate ligase
MMKLRDLLRDVPVRALHGSDDIEIASVVSDSRLATKGSLFVAVPGLKTDGAKFISAAIEKGAAAVAAESGAAGFSPPKEGAFIDLDDARAALALIAANFYDRPAGKLSLAGITGTSGKTTTAKMVEAIFDAGREPAGLIGTIEYRAGNERLMADRTTPDAIVLQQWFAKMVDAGVKRAVMEVSSHALALKRTFGVHFAAAAFTNLSQDHFDFHKDFEDYYRAKRLLFDQIDGGDRAVVNVDDDYGRRLIDELGGKPVTFGRKRGDIHPLAGFEITTRGLHGVLATPIGDVRVDSPLLGAPNLMNWMAAVGLAIVMGIGRQQIEAGIRGLLSVRGRFETVPSADGPAVIIDYAHKPDAMQKLLRAVRDLAGDKRVIILFGCGGDRDKDKRPKMGAIAARLADDVVLTSDNPRSEKPEAILDDIERGMAGATNYRRIVDRRQAIQRAIDSASSKDVVVIAGKGHESYQVVGDEVIHFDDREEAELALKKRHDKKTVKFT